MVYNTPVKLWLLTLLGALAVFAFAACDDAEDPVLVRSTATPTAEPTAAPPLEATPTPESEQSGGGPSMTVATIDTNHGAIVIELFPQEAPKTVNNFVTLSRDGFYDGVIFHRVIPNFMIQGGDPTGTGTGGPGYTFEDEFHPSLRFDKAGLLAMANAGPGTNGSQFFITTVPTPHLNDKHTIFGRVTQGQDVVEAISKVQRNPRDKPLEDVVIQGVQIDESPGG